MHSHIRRHRVPTCPTSGPCTTKSPMPLSSSESRQVHFTPLKRAIQSHPESLASAQNMYIVSAGFSTAAYARAASPLDALTLGLSGLGFSTSQLWSLATGLGARFTLATSGSGLYTSGSLSVHFVGDLFALFVQYYR